jgi:hypothetical protein
MGRSEGDTELEERFVSKMEEWKAICKKKEEERGLLFYFNTLKVVWLKSNIEAPSEHRDSHD